MKITPVDHGLQNLVGKSMGPRSKGLHMSDIYGSLFQELEPKRYAHKADSPLPLLRFEAGLALESILEEGLKRRLVERPGEFTTPEGIIFSPDLILFNGTTRVGEMKLTWLSSREVPREPSNGFPPKFDKYFVQMKAYCRCLETADARLIAFFINGDYDRKRNAGPELLAWDITFSKRELEENWAMLISHAKSKGML